MITHCAEAHNCACTAGQDKMLARLHDEHTADMQEHINMHQHT